MRTSVRPGLICMPPELAFAEPRVRRIARAICRVAKHVDAEDLMQEARLELWLRAHVLAGAVDDVHRVNLAGAIARTAMFRTLRRAGYRYEPLLSQLDFDAIDEPAGSEDPVSAARALQAARAIDAMPAPLPDVARLLANDWSANAAAKLLGVSWEAFDRFRTRLRRRLSAYVGA